MMNNLASAVLTATIAFFAIATLFVVLRFVSQAVVVQQVVLHDYLMLLAWVLALGVSVSICVATTHGLGLHSDQVPPEWKAPLSRAIYAFAVLYNPALMAVKSSILAFYLKLTKRNAGWVRVATYITLVFVNVAGVTLTCLFTFGCHPLSVSLNLFVSNAEQCLDQVILYVVSAPINLVTDIAIFLIPMPLLTALRLPRKQKIILLLTFSTGLFVIALSVLRVVYLRNAAVYRATGASHKENSIADRYDLSWSLTFIFLWSAIEVDLEIMCGCVPTLKSLISKLIPGMIRDAGETRTTGSSSQEQSTSQDAPPLQLVRTYTADFQPAGVYFVRNGGSSALHSNPSSQGSSSIDNALSSVTTSRLDHPMRTASATQAMAPMSRPLTSSTVPGWSFSFSSQRPKSLQTHSWRESIRPICLILPLFLYRGFAYGMFDVLNAQFRMAVGLPRTISYELHAAEFCGYALAPLFVARPLLKRLGMKWTFLTGLAIYACGTLVFWPAAVLVNLATFYVSNFIVGSGLAVLDTSINLSVCLCGPMEWAEVRLNLVRGCQSATALASYLLCQRALFLDVDNIANLVNAQWAYLAISLISVLVLTVYYYLPIPEAPDEELKDLAHAREADFSGQVCGLRVVWVTLALGTFSLFCFFGARECMSTKNQTFVQANVSKPSPPVYGFFAIGLLMFAVGQWLTALVQLFVKPYQTLPVSYTGSIVFAVLCMDTRGYAGITMGILLPLFVGPIFGTTYPICIRGMGKHTKTTAAILITSTTGGVPFPIIQNSLHTSRSAQYAYCVIVALCVSGSLFALYVNLIPAARRNADPRRTASPPPLSSRTEPA